MRPGRRTGTPRHCPVPAKVPAGSGGLLSDSGALSGMAFDPQLYKTTTRTQWQDAAAAWHRWGPTIEDWLAAATDRMLDAAGVTTGSRVLDVAAGAGGQTLAAARRAGPTGHVLAT